MKPALKKHFVFQEIEFFDPSLKKLLHFRREFAKPGRQKFIIFLFTLFVCFLRENISNISTKEKSLLYFPYKEANFLN